MKGMAAVLCVLIALPLMAQNACLQKEMLFDADRQMEKTAAEEGILQAFERFASDDAVLIPRFGHPIRGKDAFRRVSLNLSQDTIIDTPRWKPIWAEMAESGDMGVTFGRYPLLGGDSTAYPTAYNYYISVWERQKSGAWALCIHVGLLNLNDVDIPPYESSLLFSEEAMAIVEVDRAFSTLSSEEGYLEAFYRNIADDGLALSGNGRPPSSKEQYRRLVERYPAGIPGFRLIWEPVAAGMSSSGELGFTHGRYRSASMDADGHEKIGYGYFLSIWKKQPDGTWKFVLDGGNESPPNGISDSE